MFLHSNMHAAFCLIFPPDHMKRGTHSWDDMMYGYAALCMYCHNEGLLHSVLTNHAK